MHRPTPHPLAMAIFAGLIQLPAQAALYAVDTGPYNLANGNFAAWYQDSHGRVLDLCLSKAVSSRVAGAPGAPSYMCTLLPTPGVFDDTQPIQFPSNFPDEAFWFTADAAIVDAARGIDLSYGTAIEAAFSAEETVEGDQVSFARVRIRVDVPVAGTYVVTHPYGVEVFDVPAAGRRAINMTRDIGIGSPADFSGALKGDVGPFLRSVNGPYTETNPGSGASERYIGDPNLEEPVTGSPFNTNFVRIQGPAGTIQTNTFTVSGKVLDQRQQTPVELQRATYQRNGAGTRVEVFAKAPNSASLCLRNGLALVGTPPSPCQFSLTPDNNGLFFSQQLSQAAPPPVVVVTASSTAGTTRPTALSSKLSDVVKVRTARYDWANKRLLIEASSSDEVQVPDLVAQGFGRLSKSGTLQSLTVSDLTQPPASITVKSAHGGSDVEPVTVVGAAPVAADNQSPVAQADNGSTSVGVPLTLNLLANDSDPDGNVPLTITDLTQPGTGLGSVVLNGTTAVTYTPPPGASNAFVAFSSPATVTLQVSPRPAQETFTVTAATVTARSNNRFNWDISGTSSVTTGNTITVQVTTPDGLVTLGSTTVPVTGRWRLAVSNSTTVIPTANPTATIRSSQGTVRTVPVNVQ